MASPSDWGRFAQALRELPEDKRLLTTKHFTGRTSDTGLACGCAIGQLLRANGKSPNEDNPNDLAFSLGCEHPYILTDIYEVNDAYKPMDHTDVACRERYAHVLAECEKRSKSDV